MVAFALALSVTTCVETTDPTLVPTTLTITPSAPLSLTAIGATRQLMAVATAANGDTIRKATVAWSTSSATVVTVSTTGLATAIGNGNATVVATVDNLTASITVTVAQVAAQTVKLSGDAQTDTVDHTLPQPIVVQVNDATGHAMTGVSVAFAVAAGSGSVGSSATMTNASGQAQTTWTLGTSAGSQTANATVSTLPVQSFAATATAGAPASVAKLAGDGQTAGNGQAVAVRPVVIVRDAFNNPTPGVAVTFTTPGNGSIEGASQTTNAGGIATVGGWTLGNTGTDTLRATVTGSGISSNPAIFTAVSTAQPPVPTTFELTPATPFALTAIGATRQITAVAKDQNGDPLVDAGVTWTTSNAAAVTVGTTGLATAVANGSADVTATWEGLTASVTVTVAQAATQVVKVSGDAQNDTVDQTLSQPLVVQVNDANGYPIEGVNVGFAAAAGSGSVGSAATMTNASGQAQTTWTLGIVAGGQSASATVGALPVQSFNCDGDARRAGERCHASRRFPNRRHRPGGRDTACSDRQGCVRQRETRRRGHVRNDRRQRLGYGCHPNHQCQRDRDRRKLDTRQRGNQHAGGDRHGLRHQWKSGRLYRHINIRGWATGPHTYRVGAEYRALRDCASG